MRVSKSVWSEWELDVLAAAGITNCDYSLSAMFVPKGRFSDIFSVTDRQIYDIYAPIREKADKLGIKIPMTHGLGDAIVKECKGGIKEYVARSRATYLASKILGAKYCVQHPSYNSNRKYEIGMNEEIEHMIYAYGSCNDALEETGVICCIENMFSHDEIQHHRCPTNLSRAKEMVTVSDALGKNFAVCFDIGHSIVTEDDPVQAIYTLGDRIVCLHAHGGDGMWDLHQMPYVPQGIAASCHPIFVDWNAVMKALADIGYKGDLNFEVGFSSPAPVRVSEAKYLNAIGKHLVSVYEKALKEKK